MKCKKGFDVKPLKSAAGYYIGTLDRKDFRTAGSVPDMLRPKKKR